MPSFTELDRARYMASELTLMRDTAVNGRTSISTPCRVSDGRQHTRLSGLPSYLAPRMKLIILPDGQDVRAGDVYTITGHAAGIYTTVHDLSPGTLSTSTRILCLPSSEAPGSGLPVATNVTVQLWNPQNPNANPGSRAHPITAQVYLYPAMEDIQQYGLEPGLDFAILFDPTLADSSGNLVDTGWEVASADALGTTNGQPNSSTLKRVSRTFGMLSMARGYFVGAD